MLCDFSLCLAWTLQTPLIARFSTVIHERGSPETLRDPRGFAVKFYTRCVVRPPLPFPTTWPSLLDGPCFMLLHCDALTGCAALARESGFACGGQPHLRTYAQPTYKRLQMRSEGNFDLVGNNIPVFFVRDGMKFPDMVRGGIGIRFPVGSMAVLEVPASTCWSSAATASSSRTWRAWRGPRLDHGSPLCCACSTPWPSWRLAMTPQPRRRPCWPLTLSLLRCGHGHLQVHALKPNPKNHIQENWRIADFFSHIPESMHMASTGLSGGTRAPHPLLRWMTRRAAP